MAKEKQKSQPGKGQAGEERGGGQAREGAKGPQFGDGKSRFWNVLQGLTLTLVESSERPSNEPQPGERLIQVYGPYQDRQAALDRFEDMRQRLHDPENGAIIEGAR